MATVDFKNLEAPSPNVPSTGLRELPSSTLNKTWFSALYKMANSITGALNSFLPRTDTKNFSLTSQEILTKAFVDNFKGVRQSAISESVVSEVAFNNQENDPIVALKNKANSGVFETIVSPTTIKINDKISFNSSTRTVKAVSFEGTCTKADASSFCTKRYQNLLFSINSNNNSAEGGYASNCQWDIQANSLLVNKINVSGVEVNIDSIVGTSARANKITFYTSSEREFSCPLLTKNVAPAQNNYYSIITHQNLENHGSYEDFSQIESIGGNWLNFKGIMSHADTLKFVEVDQSQDEYFPLLNEKTAYSQNWVKDTIKIGPEEVHADSFIGGTTDYCETTEKIYLSASPLFANCYPIFGKLDGSFYVKANSDFAIVSQSTFFNLSTKIIGKSIETKKFSNPKTMQFKNNNKAFLSGIGSSKFEDTSTTNGSITISSSLIRNFSLINFTGYASPSNPINVGHSSFFILMNVWRQDQVNNKLICFYINVNGKSSQDPNGAKGFYYRRTTTTDTEYLFRLEKVDTYKYCIACYRSVPYTNEWALIDKTNTYVRNVIVIPFD